MDFEAVDRVIRRAAGEAVVPRFRALADGDVEEKAPGELVTVADRDCERILSQALPYIVDAPVIGEERATADPASMELLASDGAAWLVDPIDGTAGFVEGSPEYAVMVAHVDRGRTVASWIYQPEFDRMAIASRGAGATVDGRTARASRPPSERAAWQGVIKDRFLPSVTRRVVEANAAAFGQRHRGGHCAGIEYPALVAGEHAFLVYWRTLPWDHAPGVLLAEEAGCRARRPDGGDYSVGSDAAGLVVAHRSVIDDVRTGLFGR